MTKQTKFTLRCDPEWAVKAASIGARCLKEYLDKEPSRERQRDSIGVSVQDGTKRGKIFAVWGSAKHIRVYECLSE